MHDDLKFTNERVITMKILLNVYSTFPKQAVTINTYPTREKMKENDYIMKASINTSESIIIAHKFDINNLKEENSYLKRNLQRKCRKIKRNSKSYRYYVTNTSSEYLYDFCIKTSLINL
ncbi:15209_t:CDS:2 [Funneliformis geosporum]|uniref:15209_t:CDS:1 n=1 Tax=Funneliformis geosporum TaxID=1117311 RepID=A0A9W4WQU5_9GLOM|nr:15209_t:CDS:2 [Funneliformis geosporum]